MNKLTFAVVGDIMLNSNLEQNSLYETISHADISFGNLEIPFSHQGIQADKFVTFCAPPELAKELSSLKLKVVSVANNHSLDYGPEALADTLKTLKKVNIIPIGAGLNLEEALRPAILNIGGFTIGFLAFASTLPPGFAATDKRAGVAPIRIKNSISIDGIVSEEQPGTSPYVYTEPVKEDLERGVKVVKGLCKSVDLVIVSIHWGVPPGWAAAFQEPLADYQQPIGRALIDAGADMIIGHHPHILHGIELYQGAPIFYSMGNFIFHHLKEKGTKGSYQRPTPPYKVRNLDIAVPEAKESLIVKIIFKESIKDSSIEQKMELIPCVLNHSGEPHKASLTATEEILTRVQKYSKHLGTNIEVEDNEGFIRLARKA